jgi:hypothetical protein
MLNMANAASAQALEEGKRVLRDFLESSETGRQVLQAPSVRQSYEMGGLTRRSKVKTDGAEEEEEEI